jgi:membrane protein YdbS with pleckstrin-like domain
MQEQPARYHRRMTVDGGPNEDVIWEGRPTWRAWAGRWIAGWALLPVVVGIFLLLSVWVRSRSTRWKLTSRRIERETGFLSKKVDTLELWRIRDIAFRQSLIDRMMGVSCLSITAHDGSSPVLEIRGAPGDRAVYDRLMSALMLARQQRGVMNLNP